MFERSTSCFGGVSRRIRKNFRIALKLMKEHLSRKTEGADAHPMGLLARGLLKHQSAYNSYSVSYAVDFCCVSRLPFFVYVE